MTGDRSEELFHDQLWAATSTTQTTVSNNPGNRLRLTFDIPEDMQGIYLSAGERIIFWER